MAVVPMLMSSVAISASRGSFENYSDCLCLAYRLTGRGRPRVVARTVTHDSSTPVYRQSKNGVGVLSNGILVGKAASAPGATALPGASDDLVLLGPPVRTPSHTDGYIIDDMRRTYLGPPRTARLSDLKRGQVLTGTVVSE